MAPLPARSLLLDVSTCENVAARLFRLFRIVLLLQLLNLLPLLLDLTVLRRQFALGLGVVVIFLLHMMTNGISAHAADTRADKGARYRVMHRGADDRSSTATDQRSNPGAFLGIGELRPRDCWYGPDDASQCDYRYPFVPHWPIFLALLLR
jgi:hypothetical protein